VQYSGGADEGERCRSCAKAKRVGRWGKGWQRNWSLRTTRAYRMGGKSFFIVLLYSKGCDGVSRQEDQEGGWLVVELS
jgi:hypothetical protein